MPSFARISSTFWGCNYPRLVDLGWERALLLRILARLVCRKAIASTCRLLDVKGNKYGNHPIR